MQKEKSIEEFLTVSNSLALFALISGDSCFAKDCLSAQFIVCRHRAEFLKYCFDGFVNVLRLFNRFDNTSMYFEQIITEIIKGPDEIGRTPVRFVLGNEDIHYVVPKSCEIALLQNIVYELMVGQNNKVMAFNLLEDLKAWSRPFGAQLILMELETRLRKDICEPHVRGETVNYLYDKIIKPAYTCDLCIDFDERSAENALSTCILGAYGLQAAHEISPKYFRILEFIVLMARKFERVDLVRLFCAIAVEVAADDWYMTEYFRSIMNCERSVSLAEVYSAEKVEFDLLVDDWRNVFCLLRSS